jgi:hypothetical protein
MGYSSILGAVTNRPLRALLAAALLAMSFATTAESRDAPASAAQTCKPPKYPGNGYFTSLTVKRASCARGRDVAMAYYRCRVRKGIRARCTKRVGGFHCKEVRQSIPTEFDAKVTCTRGSSRVVHTYQQNT